MEPPEREITALATAADVSAAGERIYGCRLETVDADGRLRVLHPTAVWRRGDGALVTLEINDATPPSAHDFFVLNLCRARADAIVTTGKILRQERELRHDLQGSGRVPEALAAWRRESLGKGSPPYSLVLTSGRGLDLGHPLFHGATRPLVFTSRDGRERIGGEAARAGVEVAGVDEPGLRSAIAFARERLGAATVSIEAGPSTSAALYEPPAVAVDELLLSVYESAELDERARGKPFLDPRRIEALFERPRPFYRATAASGPWSFSRYLRRRSP